MSLCYISPIFRDGTWPQRWRTFCIYCKARSPQPGAANDLLLLAELQRIGWSFIKDGGVFHPVCPLCLNDPRCTWDGEECIVKVAQRHVERADRRS